MGIKNFLVEGVSCTGKTSVFEELQSRGYDAINGDDELAYQGDPTNGRPVAGSSHENHIWDERKVRAIAADRSTAATFFCGGSRNFMKFLDVFDDVFVLEIDVSTLRRRLDERPTGEFGAEPEERELVMRLHRTREDVPSNGTAIDATAPLSDVVDEIVRRTVSPQALSVVAGATAVSST